MTSLETLEKAIKKSKKEEAEEIAEKIRNSDTWIPEINLAFCRLADLEKEYETADDDFEKVIEKAADILNVEIY